MSAKDDDARAALLRDAAAGDPRRRFSDPLAVVEHGGPYLDRLDVLQRWRSLAAQEGDAAACEAVDKAIRALEQGAADGQDPPEEAPDAWGYGVPRGD
jgi:hypothetical protein